MRFIQVSIFASVALAHANGGLGRVARRHYGESHDEVDSTTTTTSTRYHTATVYESYPSEVSKHEDTKPGKVCKKKKHPVAEASAADYPAASAPAKYVVDSGKSIFPGVPTIPELIKDLPKPFEWLSGGKKDDAKAVSSKTPVVSSAKAEYSSKVESHKAEKSVEAKSAKYENSVAAYPSAAPSASPSGRPGKGGKGSKKDDEGPAYGAAPSQAYGAAPSQGYAAAPSESHAAAAAAPSEASRGSAPSESAAAAAAASPSGGRGGGRGPRPSAAASAAGAAPSTDPELALVQPSGDWLQPAASAAPSAPAVQAAAPAPSAAPAAPAPSEAAAPPPTPSSEEVVVIVQTVNVIPVQASTPPTRRMRAARRDFY